MSKNDKSSNEKKYSTHVRKHIGRKIQTRQFESLDISIESEDVIEWDNMEERQEKMDKVTELALIDYRNTYDKVLDELGLSEKKAFVHRSGSPEQDESKNNGSNNKSNKSEEKSDNGESVDPLDIFDGIE